jgi:hypothetical protein
MKDQIYKEQHFTKMQDIIAMSIVHEGENEYHSCDIKIKEEGRTYHAHEVSICNRDLLFFCDKGAINYVINSYGDAHYLELINIEV